jgi:antitoxin (DNA-binding transcriptional repressor) of toxin-antitoxin stability system
MRTVNVHEAKTHLSRLVEQAAKGEPLVKVVAPDARPRKPVRRLGLMAGQISVPDDFDRMGDEEIIRLFEGDPE